MSLLLLLNPPASAATPPTPPPATASSDKLFPATTTFPNTTVYAGQGSYPIARCRVSFSDVSVSTPVWSEVAHQDFRAFTVSRGRETELEDFDAGTASVVFDNRDRAYDPNTNANVRPLNRVWIYEEFSGEVHDLFKGYVESWDQEWPAPGFSDAIVTASCVDEFKVLSLSRLPTTSPPRNDYGEVVMFDNPDGYWSMGTQDFDARRISGEVGPDFTSITDTAGNPFVQWGVTFPTGAIVGDQRQNAGSLVFQQESSVSSGVLNPEDTLAMSSLTAFTVEAWFDAAFLPTSGTETIIRGPVGTTFIYKFQIQVTTAGVITATAANNDNVLSTVSGGILATGSARTYNHVVLRLLNGVLSLWVNGSQVSTAPFSGATNFGVNQTDWFTGYNSIDPNTHADWRIAGDSGVEGYYEIDELAFYRLGLSDARIAAHYQAGTQRGWMQMRSGQRIGAVLDTLGSTAPRAIASGVRFVTPSYMVGQAPLDEIRKAVAADNVSASFFVSAGGKVIFRDANRSSNGELDDSGTALVTIGDRSDLGEVQYLDLDVDYSESFLFNEWNVTATNGTTQTSSDATSIGRYFKRSQSLTDVPVLGDADAATIATSMLAKYKDPIQRIQRVDFSTASQEASAAFFRRELTDLITVKWTPPGGGSRISQDSRIQKIDISGDNGGGPWSLSWSVSPV